MRRKRPRRHLLRPNVGAGGSRKSSVSESLQRTRPGLSRLFDSARTHASPHAPLEGVAAGLPPLPPLPE